MLDVTPDNGALHYYPGSHALPEYSLYDLNLSVEQPLYGVYEDFAANLMRVHGFTLEEFIVPKGSALVWSSNLLHGGSPVRDPNATRWSQVTHYYFEDCVYYTPIYSNPVAFGELALRDVVDVRTNTRIPHKYNGSPVRATQLAGGRHHISFESSPPLASDVVGRIGLFISSVLRRPSGQPDQLEEFEARKALETLATILRARADVRSAVSRGDQVDVFESNPDATHVPSRQTVEVQRI